MLNSAQYDTANALILLVHGVLHISHLILLSTFSWAIIPDRFSVDISPSQDTG